MKVSRPASLALAALLAATLPAAVSAQDHPGYGPERGTLVIAGGGNLDGTGIVEKFIELGGGPERGRFVIIPTSGGNFDDQGNPIIYDEGQVLSSWWELGLKHVTMLHTYDPRVADTEDFVDPLREATGVWFNGGRQWNFVDSYAGTRAYEEFHRVLERGGVIGGSSAGASIQGDYLVRGDTQGSDIVMTDEKEHERGFQFLRHVAIDQHINTRNRWDDLVPLIRQRPDLLGIGLSEGTAIIVSGDRFQVMGKWKVAVHDNTRVYQPWEKSYFVLSAGDVYDMKERRILKLGDGSGRGGH